MTSLKDKIVCVTGASSGIGAATAREFARQGAHLILAARRGDRLEKLAGDIRKETGVRVHTVTLDVRKQSDVEKTFASLPPEWTAVDILVNNAGLSRGLVKLQDGLISDWEEMIDTNVKGLLYVTRAILPGMLTRESGHVINIGSVAGHQVYPNGNVYCASKHAVDAITKGLKMDLLGTNIRVSTVDPGLVETEFSEVRFHGDAARAATVYAGLTPLTGSDIAEIVIFCATRPPHVNLFQAVVYPVAQSWANQVARKETKV